ncbi:NAD(P)/FAD-dependent oxidoreductase [Prevotella sp. HUN102]|uniref:NAD(P)/FAD-dependent oxidoreductase n=1 Tax=Prevotella sp. HUN102 TaxID=1392486 RepID=UPI00048DE8A4|nr:NAD(P)/FAD-dependent oxidoreductase [Prevotella sp. HUN102]
MSHIAIIGGGAAGFFAAIAAKETNPHAKVTIFEKAGRVLAKVGVSGGGRCNLTNSFEEITDLKQAYPRGDKLLKRLFKSFDHKDAYRWFEEHGVKLTTQADQCVFPVSQDSQTVIDCLTHTASKLGVEVKTHYALEAVEPLSDGRLEARFKAHGSETFDRIIVTTGGSPRAEGLQYLASLGHKIEAPVPSLFTFNVSEKAFCSLMGTVVEPVSLSIPSTKFRSQGPLLITHWGMSGPATLKLSSYAARYVSECDYEFPVSVNWLNETNASIVEERITGIIAKNPKKQLGSVRPYELSGRIWNYLIERAGLSPEKRWEELGKKSINKLIETLTNDTHRVSGRGTFRDEFVTCGGVSLKSINSNTLESKLCPGLFFAGEMLDIDAITGGFNLQAAWTTGKVAGSNRL